MKTPVLETERLILRPVTMGDAPSLQKHFNNWNIIQHLSMVVPWPYPDDGASGFLEHILLPAMTNGEAHAWAITIKDNGDELVGLVEYRTEKKADESGNRGFWLSESYWGRGYMSEAITAIQDWLFFELQIDRMEVVNAITNPASRRVKEKTGAKFLRNGKLPHRSGEEDTEVWEITAESWRAYRNG